METKSVQHGAVWGCFRVTTISKKQTTYYYPHTVAVLHFCIGPLLHITTTAPWSFQTTKGKAGPKNNMALCFVMQSYILFIATTVSVVKGLHSIQHCHRVC